MATPLGVYLHDGVSSGGAGFWGLFLTGVTMSLLALTAQAAAHGLAQAAGRASCTARPAGRQRRRLGLQLWLSAISPWLPLPLVFLLLRLVPMSGTHAAEHQVVHCIEHHAPLVPSCVRAMPRVHPRCGTNLFAGFTLFLLTFLGVFCAAQAGGWPLLDGASLAAMLAAPVTLIFWRRVGGWMQLLVCDPPGHRTSRSPGRSTPPNRCCRGGSGCRLADPLRFALLRRIWTMGFPQICWAICRVRPC